MNQKGFAVSGIIYTLMVLFIILIIAVLSMFNSRKTVLDELKNKVLNNMNVNVDLSTKIYNPTNNTEEYRVQLKGYYNLILTSSNGSVLDTTIYLKEGEIITLKVGSKTYNSGNSEIYIKTTSPVIQVTNTNYKIDKKYNNSDFINTFYTKKANTIGNGNISISYVSTERLNGDLNKVRYIKDCINGNNVDNNNIWSEIKVIASGENKAFEKLKTDVNKSAITDGNFTTSITTSETCITIDLERTYNVDYIITKHQKDRKFYNHKIYVSATGDANTYKTIYNYEEIEGEEGKSISAFEKPKTLKIGNVYLPVKQFLNSSWLRIFHHNNVNGTVLWSAKAQVIAQNGYDEIHKQSGLYYLENFKSNNRYELLLEYPDIDNTKYNRWTQTSNFNTSTSISGFSAIKTDFTSTYAPFNGLKLNGANTIISGNTGWYYAIGAITSTNNGILGYNTDPIRGTVDLWININQYLQ